MLDETAETKIIGYTVNREPVFLNDYQKEIAKRNCKKKLQKEIAKRITKIKSGKAKTFTSQEVRNSI